MVPSGVELFRTSLFSSFLLAAHCGGAIPRQPRPRSELLHLLHGASDEVIAVVKGIQRAVRQGRSQVCGQVFVLVLGIAKAKLG
jgi:hypothetical protein